MPVQEFLRYYVFNILNISHSGGAMYFEEIGHKVREARIKKGMTQAVLAKSVGLSRTTINQLESGAGADLGVKKLMAILEALGLDISVSKPADKRVRDYLELACISANVSYRSELGKQELARALVTGKIPKEKRPQLRVVFDELPPSIFDGMVRQVGAWCSAKKLARNISAIAKQIHSQRVATA